jgi:thiamine transporter ThiT
MPLLLYTVHDASNVLHLKNAMYIVGVGLNTSQFSLFIYYLFHHTSPIIFFYQFNFEAQSGCDCNFEQCSEACKFHFRLPLLCFSFV